VPRTRVRFLVRSTWQAVRRAVSHGGFLFLAGVAVVGAAAAVSANNLLFLVLATMLAVLLVSGLVNRLCLSGLELDFVLPDHVSAKRAVAATVAVRNTKSHMPSFSIRVGGVAEAEAARPAILRDSIYLPVIPGGATVEEFVDVVFPRRGEYRQSSFFFATSFPFGFQEKSVEVKLRRDVVVYPSLEPQPAYEELVAAVNGELETALYGHGHDFYRIRPYQVFESARHLDWRASAHTGEMQVREFSREQERVVEVFLDRGVPSAGHEWFEQAVECCAYLIWKLAGQGAEFVFRSQGYALRAPREGDVYHALRYLALVAPLIRPAEPPPPESSAHFQIVFTTAEEAFLTSGWTPAHVVGPDWLRAGL
jgi:uncharacterized protein (DUF58 family)